MNVVIVLNIEGWERLDENGEEDVIFIDNCLMEFYDYFKVSFLNVGVDGLLYDLLE